MIDSLSQPVFERLTVTLLHFLWQGFAIALVLGAVRWLLAIQTARSRYAVALGALGLMAICPVITFVVMVDGIAPSTPHSLAAGNADVFASGEEADTRSAHSPASGIPSHHATRQSAFIDAAQPWLLAVWLLGVTVFSLRLCIGYATTLLLRRDRRPIPAELLHQVAALGRRLGVRATARVFSSGRVREATVVGFLQPVILLPLTWLTELPPDVLRAVIAHELAHIRRWDLWINLLQRVIETLLFYHPAVWWLSRTVRLEREKCCDELAVAVTGGRVVYARSLELVARHFTSDQPHLAASFSGGRSMNLLHRIHYVLESGSTPKSSRWWPVGLLALILPVGVLATSFLITPIGQPVARAQDDREDGDRRGTEADRGRAQLEQTFAAYDTNKDGKVTIEEFIAALGGKDKPEVRDVAERQFAVAA